MASVSSRSIRYDASLPPGTIRRVRTERERPAANLMPPGDALRRGATTPREPDVEREDEEIRATDDDTDDEGSDGDTASPHGGKRDRSFVQLFEEVHTLIRELDAHGRDTGRHSESTTRELLDGHAKKNDARVAQARARRIDETGGGQAILRTRERVEDRPEAR